MWLAERVGTLSMDNLFISQIKDILEKSLDTDFYYIN